MGRWIRFAVLLWLVIAAAIVVVSVIRIFDSRVQGTHTKSGPVFVVDDMPAGLYEEFSCSVVERAGRPAWRMRTTYLVPSGSGDQWRIDAVEKPFHMTVVRRDGTRTGPHRVEINLALDQGWSAEGNSFVISDGLTAYPTDSSDLNGRRWDTIVLSQCIVEVCGWILLAGIIIAVVTAILRARCERMYPHLCRQCGYDLRGSTDAGCPECGAGRPRN